MKMKKDSKTGSWLVEKFFLWQQEHGEIKSQAEFAHWLGVPPSTLSNWIKGGFEARGPNLAKMAAKLNDFEIYDILGYSRPDERLPMVASRWETIPESIRAIIVRLSADEALPVADIATLAEQLSSKARTELLALLEQQ